MAANAVLGLVVVVPAVDVGKSTNEEPELATGPFAPLKKASVCAPSSVADGGPESVSFAETTLRALVLRDEIDAASSDFVRSLYPGRDVLAEPGLGGRLLIGVPFLVPPDDCGLPLELGRAARCVSFNDWRDTRGETALSPSSFRSASAVSPSRAATLSMSSLRSVDLSAATLRIECAMTDGECW